MIELSVSPHYLNEPDLYRKSVIRIGFVLNEIERTAAEFGRSVQIHTFPSMLDSRLIASAELKPLKKTRYTPPVGAPASYSTPGGHQATGSILPEPAHTLAENIKTLAAAYGLTFTPVQCEEFVRFQENPCKKLLQKVAQCAQSFAISSPNDNPFIWVKTGICLNKIEKLIETESPEFTPEYHINISAEFREATRQIIPECTSLQAIFFACKPMLMY